MQAGRLVEKLKQLDLSMCFPLPKCIIVHTNAYADASGAHPDACPRNVRGGLLAHVPVHEQISACMPYRSHICK
eukprot:6212533-Pleurochrysis_carterae.AAC.2